MLLLLWRQSADVIVLGQRAVIWQAGEVKMFLALVVWILGGSGPLLAAELQEFAGCRLGVAKWADGDSFPVVLKRAVEGREAREEEHVMRLYFVDAPETTAESNSDKKRVRAQARHFGVSDPKLALEFGKVSKERVEELLKEPFTVHTAFASALGRSKKPRVYAFVTLADGSDLAATLVAEGLARAYGQRRTRPEGTRPDEWMQQLQDLEVAAALGGKGFWAKSEADKIRELRAKEREEAADLDAAFEKGVFAPFDEENRVNLNTATAEELQELKGIGPKLAELVIAGRPYKTVDEVKRVKGIAEGKLKDMRGFVTVGGENGE